jgi:hypothetical protein
MKGFLLSALIFAGCATPHHSAFDTDSKRVLTQAFTVTHSRNMLYCYMPSRTETLSTMIAYASSQRQPLVIYSPNPQLATRAITNAFGVIRRGALRGLKIVAAVGKENDRYIRPVIEATGATLYVEPLP